MTPQELEKTLDFILQHQAQASVHLERLTERQGEMQSMLAQMTELALVQSSRLDRHDEMFHSMQVWQKEALSRLDQILRRLTPDH